MKKMSDQPVKIKVIANGPLFVSSVPAEVELPDGTTQPKERPFSLCRCGHSQQKPYCDGSHVKAGFEG
ncbi:MAG: CDGSH iron-sulfur domain-containing protein [bacterium]